MKCHTLKFTINRTKYFVLSEVIFFSLVSLVAAGFLDIVYKKTAELRNSLGIFFVVGGASWLSYQFIFSAISGQNFNFDSVSVLFGLLTGTLAVVANIALVEGLKKVDVSLGSTIYRLNTIGVVVLSYIFLGEGLSFLKIIGIGLGIFSIFIIYNQPNDNKKVNYLKGSILILIFASAMRAIFGIFLKLSVTYGAHGDTVLLFIAGSWMIGGIFYYILREWSSPITCQKVLIGIIAGLLIMAVAHSLLEALKFGHVSIVASIANLSFIIALVISLILKMETISLRKVTAIGLASASILVLAQLS